MILHNDNCFTLQVSCAEALDKLSILQIKLEKIKDNRAIEVKKEYDLLHPILYPSIQSHHCEHLYKLLVEINTSIWDKQDLFKSSSPTINKTALCTQIIEENDIRFRIKNKINHQFNSRLKEQKGYQLKKALVIPHLLMGDQILMISAVRYLSILYDQVHLLCLSKYINQIKLFYSDDPTIVVVQCTDNWWRDPIFYQTNGLEQFDKKDIYVCGIHTEYVKGVCSASCAEVPFCFYRHMNLPYNVFWNYFYINQVDPTVNLFRLLQKYNISEYIFAHCETGRGPLISIPEIEKHSGKSINEILLIDPNTNKYPSDHKFYPIAQQMVGHNINYYVDLMINASYLYLSDSCFFCLAMLLGIKTDYCYVRSRFSYNYNYIWKNPYGFNADKIGYGSPSKMKVFKPFG
jgi:hypothetical protein